MNNADKDNNLAEFVRRTECPTWVAVEYLTAEEWDFDSALDSYLSDVAWELENMPIIDHLEQSPETGHFPHDA